MDRGICRNDRCRANGIERFVYLGDWFVDDAVQCPFCGEAMETTVVIENGLDRRRDRPESRGSIALNRVPRRWV